MSPAAQPGRQKLFLAEQQKACLVPVPELYYAQQMHMPQVIELTENLVKEARSKELVQEHAEESSQVKSAPQSKQLILQVTLLTEHTGSLKESTDLLTRGVALRR